MRYRLLSLLPILIIASLVSANPRAAQAQGRLDVSTQADFSTRDHRFEAGDSLYLRLTARHVDASEVTRSEFEIEPVGDGESFSGVLENNLDGTFTAVVALETLDGGSRVWRVEAEVEDDDGREVKGRTTFVVEGEGRPASAFTLRGTVEAATAGEITLGGTVVRVTDETHIVVQGVEAPGAVDLLGLRTVAVVRRDGADVIALQLIATGEELASAEIRTAGRVDAASDTSLTIRDLTFRIDATTEIEGAALAGLAGLAGQVVRVEARRAAGAWLASRVRVLGRAADAGGEDHEVEGPVADVGTDFLVVAGLTFAVTGETEFDGFEALTDLQVGDVVKVEFEADGDGYVAVSVELDDEEQEEAEDEVEVEGAVTAVGEASIEVEGVTFQITDTTRIEGSGDELLTLADLATGMVVEVKGLRLADGTVVALEIELEDARENEIEVKGAILAINDAFVTIGETRFAVTDETVITADGAALTLAELAVGMRAEAELERRADGSLVALAIEVEDAFTSDDVRAVGRIEAVSSTEVTVGELVFAISGETRITGRRGDTLTVASLSEDLRVRVEGHLDDEGVLVAEEIRVVGGRVGEGTFTGAVTSVDASTRVLVVEDVRFRAVGRLAGDLAALGAGQNVSVRYRLLGDGSRLALDVETTTEGEGGLSISGVVDEVDAASLLVAGVRVVVTDATILVGEGGLTVSLAGLEAGSHVEVDAVASAGVIQAVTVEAAGAPVVVTASVRSRSDGTFRVAGREVRLTGETLVVGERDEVLTTAEITAGAVVEVYAVRDDGSAGKTGSETLVARRVEVRDVSTSTAVEAPGAADLPARFTLDQNYPNPFNPTTTIRFEVASSVEGAVPASLTVYDVLGRQVATLMQGALTAGTYSVTWDGRDALGRLAASGVYLYRLDVGGQVQTRTMTLLK